MKSFSFLLAPIGLAIPLIAQTPPVTAVTATDFGAMANANANSDFHSIDANTAIARNFFVGARAGGQTGPGPSTRGAMAEAHSSVMLMLPGPMGAGVQIQEAGAAAGIAATDAASSGTSGSNQTDPAPVRGAHGVAVTFAAAANATGNVTLVWRGNATAGASATVDVDVDGDNVVDFHGIADGTPVQQQFPVTAGANGVVIAVTTQGAADIAGIGRENYGANLGVFFRPSVTQPTVSFTAFGPSCDGTLSGQMITTPRGNAVQLDIAGATANAFGFLMFGAQLTAPVALPGSQCQLLVENRFGGFSVLDANGDGHRVLGVPGRPPVDINFQVLTLDFSGPTLALGSTNGLNLLIQ